MLANLCFGYQRKISDLSTWNRFFKSFFCPDNIFKEYLFIILCVCAQSCPTLCNPMDCSPAGSSVHWIFQARILKWVVISSSLGSSWPRDRTHVSCVGRQILYHWTTREASSLSDEDKPNQMAWPYVTPTSAITTVQTYDCPKLLSTPKANSSKELTAW